ncbi:MAG: MFS transporter, partial [Peptostreptococcaceae bacterium]
WRNTFLLIGVIAVVQGIIILIKLKDTPKEYGFDVTKEIKIEKISVIEGLKSVLTNSSTYYNALIMFSLVGITTAFSSLWIVPYISDVYLVEKGVAAFIASFLTYGMVFGAVIMGKVFGKIKNNRLNVVRICGIINVVIWLFIIICDAKPPILFLPVLFFVIGILNMSHIEAFNDVKKNNETKYAGLSTSAINASEFIGSGIINIFIGSIMGLNLGILAEYRIGFSIFVVMNLITILGATLSIKKENKEKMNKEISI